MINTVTDSLITGYVETCEKDNCPDERCLCNNGPNSESMTNSNLKAKNGVYDTCSLINKSYEKVNNSLHESYFDMDGMDNTSEFIDDYINSYPNGVILVVNNTQRPDDINLFTSRSNSKLVCITVGKQTIDSFVTKPSGSHKKIEAKSFGSAVKTAYKLAANGQAILFQGVNKNFDLFSFL